MEKIFNGDPQPIAQLLDGGDSGAVVSSADDVIDRGLGDAAHMAKLIDGNISLFTQLQYAFSHRFADIHGYHLDSIKRIPAAA